MKPQLRPIPTKQLQHLRALNSRLQQLIDMLTAEKNRLQDAHRSMHKQIRTHIKWLQKHIDSISAEIDKTIRQTPLWHQKDAIMQSVKGVGSVTSHKLIAALPELGTINNKTIAALAGLAPMACDSGAMRGKRHIKGGPPPGCRAPCPLHGRTQRYPIQSGHCTLLSKTLTSKKAKKSRADRLRTQTSGNPQCNGRRQYTMAHTLHLNNA